MAGPERLEGLPQQPNNIQNSEKPPASSKTTNNTPGNQPFKDSVNISSENVEYQQLLKEIDKVPDIRPDRLKKIQQALKNGTYHIDSDLVANRIIQDILNEDKSSPRHSQRPPST